MASELRTCALGPARPWAASQGERTTQVQKVRRPLPNESDGKSCPVRSCGAPSQSSAGQKISAGQTGCIKSGQAGSECPVTNISISVGRCDLQTSYRFHSSLNPVLTGRCAISQARCSRTAPCSFTAHVISSVRFHSTSDFIFHR